MSDCLLVLTKTFCQNVLILSPHVKRIYLYRKLSLERGNRYCTKLVGYRRIKIGSVRMVGSVTKSGN